MSAKRRNLDPQLAKTDPQCAICRRPIGSGDGRCASAGTEACYRLGYTRVSEELALCKAQLRGVVARVDEVVAGMPDEDGGHG